MRLTTTGQNLDIDELKASLDIEDVISGYLGAPQSHGHHRKWLCPFHNDSNPSLTITNDGGAFKCWSCDAKGDAVTFVQRIENLGFIEAALRLARADYKPASRAEREQKAHQVSSEEQERSAAAVNLTAEAVTIDGTLAERYLRETRGIQFALPANLRFHPEVPENILHLVKPQRRMHYRPALVAGVVRDGLVTGCHLIYLRSNKGRAEKASIEKPKVSFGSCRGGAIPLRQSTDSLGICEGIEDGLSVMQMAEVPVWAVAGTSFLPLIAIPQSVADLHIYGQSDEPGRKAVAKASQAHARPGRNITIHYPPAPHKDWNDTLRSGL